jgi:hypothetical protein
LSSNSQRNASSPKTPISESRLSHRPRHLDQEDAYTFTDGESDFEREDPSRTTTQTEVVSTPQGGRKFFHHRNKKIEIKPLTEEQIKSDQRYHLRKMFKLAVIHDDGVSKHYQCLLCLPKCKLIWTSKTTYQHPEKHVVAVHHTKVKRYRELMANKSGYKRKRSPSPSPNQSTSDSPQAHSVSKRMKTLGGATAVQWSFYCQEDYVEDSMIEVVMNMLPFEVCAMLKLI